MHTSITRNRTRVTRVRGLREEIFALRREAERTRDLQRKSLRAMKRRAA